MTEEERDLVRYCPGANCCAPEDEEQDFDGCLHGVPWDEDCYECELEEEQFCD